MFLNREYHERFAQSKLYYPLLSVTSFFMMLFAFIPFEVILVPAVAVSCKKWKKIVFFSVLGSAIGAALLSFLFEHFGWRLIDYLLPHLTSSKEWGMIELWLSRYGAWSMMVVAALPVAQAPALAVSGFFKIPAWAIFLSFLVGKTIKYSIISWGVVAGENKLIKSKQEHQSTPLR